MRPFSLLSKRLFASVLGWEEVKAFGRRALELMPVFYFIYLYYYYLFISIIFIYLLLLLIYLLFVIVFYLFIIIFFLGGGGAGCGISLGFCRVLLGSYLTNWPYPRRIPPGGFGFWSFVSGPRESKGSNNWV